MPFDVQIINTGSSGNCNVIDGCIMIDCGLKVKRIEKELETIDALLITHRHGDHLNNACINYINKKRPWALSNLIYTNPDVVQAIQKHNKLKTFSPRKANIFETGTEVVEIEAGGRLYTVQCFICEHDVPNQGFIITNDQNETLVFATDTATMKHCPPGKFDYIVVEGNYDENKVIDYLQSDNDEDRMRAIRNLRHLSVQQLEDFIYHHSKENTIVIQLHESDAFGIRSLENTEE